VAALIVAVPLGSAADREEPWFNYKAFTEQFAGGRPIAFNWAHTYGPITWPRDGGEMLRVHSPVPFYWKADTLSQFDGRDWIEGDGADRPGDTPTADLPSDWRRHTAWNATFTVALKRLKTPTVVGAGTILGVQGSSTRVQPDAVPGRWVTDGQPYLSAGDSYTVRAHIPRPTPAQLAAATVGRDKRRHGDLQIHVDFRPDAMNRVPRTPKLPGRRSVPFTGADVTFSTFERDAAPSAHYRLLDEYGSGNAALENSQFSRTWELAQQLRDQSTSPYDYVLRVNDYLRDPRFRYTEVPPPPARGETPLESFLFDTRLGYCQQFSGAMALLLRMGGIPARVATGFSPGGYRRSTGEWIVRDTDAHSWVEAWFDGIGWVTFDPTPPATPARSQIAAIAPPKPPQPSDAKPDTSKTRPANRRPEGPTRDAPLGVAARHQGGFSWPLAALALLLVLAAGAALVASRRHRLALAGLTPGEQALFELERALRRSGRGGAIPGTTLRQLERRLGVSGDGSGYLRALRAARYGSGAVPTSAQRAAFRRELAAGLGWRGRLRALYALPPRLYDLTRRPR